MNRKSFLFLALGALGIPLLLGKKLQHTRIIYTYTGAFEEWEGFMKSVESHLRKQGAHRFEWEMVDKGLQVTAYRYA